MKRAEARALARGKLSLLPCEVKVALEPRGLRRLLRALGATKDRPKRRTVWLLDTPARALLRAGLVVRLREKDRSADLTVKARPVSAARLTGLWRRSRALEVEADVVAGRRVLSAGLELTLEPGAAAVAAGEASTVGKSLSVLQRRFLSEVARTRVPWAALHATRPAAVRVWKVKGLDQGAPLVVEAWALAGGGRLLEVSLTVPGPERTAAQRLLAALLRRAGVRRDRRQGTKSARVLQTLAAR